jgi:hypothetical protein
MACILSNINLHPHNKCAIKRCTVFQSCLLKLTHFLLPCREVSFSNNSAVETNDLLRFCLFPFEWHNQSIHSEFKKDHHQERWVTNYDNKQELAPNSFSVPRGVDLLPERSALQTQAYPFSGWTQPLGKAKVPPTLTSLWSVFYTHKRPFERSLFLYTCMLLTSTCCSTLMLSVLQRFKARPTNRIGTFKRNSSYLNTRSSGKN